MQIFTLRSQAGRGPATLSTSPNPEMLFILHAQTSCISYGRVILIRMHIVRMSCQGTFRVLTRLCTRESTRCACVCMTHTPTDPLTLILTRDATLCWTDNASVRTVKGYIRLVTHARNKSQPPVPYKEESTHIHMPP